MNQDLKPRELVEGFIDSTLDEDRLSELKQLLQTDPTLRASMVMELRLRGLLRARKNDSSGLGDAVTKATHDSSPKSLEDKIIDIINAKANPPLPFITAPKTSHRFARAAAWLAAFTWFGNKAQAAGTATTTIKTAGTVSLVLLGGGALYLIHHNNKETTARIEQLQARKEVILDSPAERIIPRTTTTPLKPTTTSPPLAANVAYLDALCDKLEYLADMREGREASAAMGAMDLEALKQLLEDAQKTERHYQAVHWILGKMAKRFPADATMLGAKVVTTRSPFDSAVSEVVGECFLAWMKADPKAADRWYLTAMNSGELIPTSIPEAGMENYLPERILAIHRFQVMLESDPEKAVSMAGDMLDEDVASAMTWFELDFTKAEALRDPISRIASQLPPEQQKVALKRYVKFMASEGFVAASAWLDAVEISETARNSLRMEAADWAYRFEKITKAEALKIIESLPDSPERKDARKRIER